MSLQLESPNDFPLDAFRALLQASSDQRELIRRYMESDEKIQSDVRSWFAVLEAPGSSPAERDEAMAAIARRLSQFDSQEATFSDRLRHLLELKNMTQEELAERVGCTQSAISKMISRNARPHRTTIFKMATALDVAPTDLWPDLEVAAILDSIAEFPRERVLTQAQAKALEDASQRPPVKMEVRDLPSRRGK